MKTTTQYRESLRSLCAKRRGRSVLLQEGHLDALLDDLDEAIAEASALRRVEQDNMQVERSAIRHRIRPERTWDINGMGCGRTLPDALADYDARKRR